MLDKNLAIHVDSISKCFQIYHHPKNRLKQFFYPRIQRHIGLSELKYYDEFWALKDVSLKVKRGQVVGIIGRRCSSQNFKRYRTG